MDKILPDNFSGYTDLTSTAENFTAVFPITSNNKTLCSIPVSRVPLEIKWNCIIKRSIDILISMLLIVSILSWLIPMLAIIIKMDSRGPVFFLQKRNKSGGRIFTCIKFRSMLVNKDADILVARENDSRITRVGKILRKYHIDELSQLLNVLIGDMSLIGPRPHMIVENKMYESLLQNYKMRHTVKPGITGLAQSMGNFGSTNDLERVKQRTHLDILYINKWSLGMDLKILMRTGLLLFGFTRNN